ncbi:MAG: hypothetical protein M1821_001463 [Bathelium mastoideum]|nr:MAG: hypothetical protein M1821_001463 [Bathelium mastoideum]
MRPSTKAHQHDCFQDTQGQSLDCEEEDEETLELELRAIEARLKLKRLQQAKARQKDRGGDQREVQRSPSPIRWKRDQTPSTPSRGQSEAIQVPLSPSDQNRIPPVQKSPARISLGIDKGLKAEDVSLKRASSVNNLYSRQSTTKSHPQEPPGLAKKTFSERIAESRLGDRERQEKHDRIRKSRSQGFNIPSEGHDNSAQSANNLRSDHTDQRINLERATLAIKLKATSLERTQLRSALHGSSRSKSLSNPPSRKNTLDTQERQQRKADIPTGSSENESSKDNKVVGSDANDDIIFEPYSGLHLSKRLINHNVLTRTLEGKEIFTIPRLFKTVKSPTYDPPDIESDYVIFAIIASKSSPYDHRQAPKITSSSTSGEPVDNDVAIRPKFMVLRLTDLTWELDLYLFGAGFTAFWKLTVGTVVALLNPGILPPRNRDTGAFSLKVTSDADAVLEVGKARDLGFCKSVKRDGKECGAWIDKRSTEYCEFHVSMLLEKTKAGRMEVNGMAGFGKGRGGSGARSGLRGRGRGDRGGGGNWGGGRRDERLGQGERHDRYLHETMYISSGSAARLLDAEDTTDMRDKAELQRKRKTEIEKETELAKRLANTGKGTGREYLQSRQMESTREIRSLGQVRPSPTDTVESCDAASLGLLGNKASDITLSPVKRGRHSAMKDVAPMGWGISSKRGLFTDSQPLPTKSNRDRSPSKKKARFMLDQGIRQPGRESLGTLARVAGEEDDDELEIV